MKKINSISYGGRLILTAFIFLLPIPLIFKAAFNIFNCKIFIAMAEAVFVIGVIFAVIIGGLLAVEFHQDKRLDLYYKSRKNIKFRLINGGYECQACGNREVKTEDKHCMVCGSMFKDSIDK